MIITIDGPTASGKSTIGRILAHKLGYYYIYSGLLYRALAYQLSKEYGYTQATVASPDHQLVQKIIERMEYIYCCDGYERIYFAGDDITPYLKQGEIDQMASIVSTNQFVRGCIDAWQRAIADHHNVVIDGRDAGTVVFPHADYKFFLTARPQIRAERWRSQQKKQGNIVDFDHALDFITVRDERDSNRANAPLKLATGGIQIDNSDIDLQETLDTMLEHLS